MDRNEDSVHVGPYPEAIHDEEDVIGPYPGGDEDEAVVGYPGATFEGADDGGVVGPYPGGGDDEAVVGPYPGASDDDEEAVVGPYPSGDNEEEAVVGPYPDANDDEDEGVVSPYSSEEVLKEEPKVTGAYPGTNASDTLQPFSAPPPPAVVPPPAPPPPPRWQPPDWAKLPTQHQPRIEAWENGRNARSMSLRGGAVFVVGRNGGQADIVVPDSSVSRAHAAIINSSTCSFVQDLHSAHGTYYDASGRTMHVPCLGELLDADAPPVKLVEGATLRFGKAATTVYRIVGLEAPAVERWRPPRWAAPPPADRELRLEVPSTFVRNPYLEHLQAEGGDVDEVLIISQPCTLFGRGSQSDVVLREDSVSRQHAVLLHDTENQTYIVDLGSASGTFVDGQRAETGPHGKPLRLSHGSVITLGDSANTYTFVVGAKAGDGQQQGSKRKRD